jgi:hypothetical protein
MSNQENQYKAQIEALQNELKKKQTYLDKANALITEIYQAMLQDRRNDMCATSEAYEVIKNLVL